MILSMTGFGRGTAVLNGREITVELRSVNSRYFDSRLKKQLNQRISRGKVELSMTVQNVDAADTVVAVNMELARSYQQAMRDLSEQLGVKNDVSTAVLTRFPDVLTTRCVCRYRAGAGSLCGDACRRGRQDEGRRGKPSCVSGAVRRQS